MARLHFIPLSLLLLLMAMLLHGCQSQPVSSTASRAQTTTPAPERLPAQLGKALQKDHYHPLQDDIISARAFDEYIHSLDPAKAYFMQSDIDQISPLRDSIWRSAIAGQLAPLQQVYGHYRKRKLHRLSWLLKNINTGTIRTYSQSHGDVKTRGDDGDSWFNDNIQADHYWSARLGEEYRHYIQAGFTHQQTLIGLSGRYSAELDKLSLEGQHQALYSFLQAVTRVHDSRSVYYPSLQHQFNPSLVGIGVVLQQHLDEARVSNVLPGSPASGFIQPGDTITAIAKQDNDFIELLGTPLDDVVWLLRGPVGSEVKLKIRHGDPRSGKIAEVSLVRRKITLSQQQLEVQYPGKGVAVVRIPSFYLDFTAKQRKDPDDNSTSRELASILDKVDHKQVDNLILDLRNNQGGALTESTETLKLFIPQGPTLQIRNNQDKIQVLGIPERQTTLRFSGKLMVLVNNQTAGAAEIVSAALQDYGRAIIIGEPTFGMGTVAIMKPLSIGFAKITTGEYARITGQSLQQLGITPDLKLVTETSGTASPPDTRPYSITPGRFTALRFRPEGNLRADINRLRSLQQDYTAKPLIADDEVLNQAIWLMQRWHHTGE